MLGLGRLAPIDLLRRIGWRVSAKLPKSLALADAPPPVHALGDGRGDVLRRHQQGRQRRRLLDLGVVVGTTIRAEFRSATGDPVAYRIRGALIALRKQQAEWILVEPAAAVSEGAA